MSEHAPSGQYGPEGRLSEIQKRFVDFVVTKAGVEYTGDTAVSVYRVLDDSLIDLLAFSRSREESQGVPSDLKVDYLDGLDQVPIYEIDFPTAGTPSNEEEPFHVIEGGNADFQLSDEEAAHKLEKLIKLDDSNRMIFDKESTETYRQS